MSTPKAAILSWSQSTEWPTNMASNHNSQSITQLTNMATENYNPNPSPCPSLSCSHSPHFQLHTRGHNYIITFIVYKDSQFVHTLQNMHSVSCTCLYQALYLYAVLFMLTTTFLVSGLSLCRCTVLDLQLSACLPPDKMLNL